MEHVLQRPLIPYHSSHVDQELSSKLEPAQMVQLIYAQTLM